MAAPRSLTPLILFLALVAPRAARAEYAHDTFLGWSPDGSFYLYASAGTDGVDHPQLCLLDSDTPPPTWPKGLAAPEDGSCASVCSDDDAGECGRTDDAKRWVKLPAASMTGPHGEKLALKMAKSRAVVAVLLGGKKIVDYEFGLFREDSKPRILDARWRPDGGAVAVLVGFPEDPHDQTPGWPPPRFVGVFSFKAQANANASNLRGMKLYHQKDFPHAGDEFKKAIAADPRHVLAHYNLACVSALGGDRKAAVAELRWLAGAPEPAAAKALAKAKSDADLKSVLGDPEVKKLLGGGTCDEMCEIKRDGCEQECTDRDDAVGSRGCFRLCGSAADGCADSCGKK